MTKNRPFMYSIITDTQLGLELPSILNGTDILQGMLFTLLGKLFLLLNLYLLLNDDYSGVTCIQNLTNQSLDFVTIMSTSGVGKLSLITAILVREILGCKTFPFFEKVSFITCKEDLIVHNMRSNIGQ